MKKDTLNMKDLREKYEKENIAITKRMEKALDLVGIVEVSSWANS